LRNSTGKNFHSQISKFIFIANIASPTKNRNFKLKTQSVNQQNLFLPKASPATSPPASCHYRQ
jgi:hypothetical protein